MTDHERAIGLLQIVLSVMEPSEEWFADGHSPRAAEARLSWPWVKAVHEVCYSVEEGYEEGIAEKVYESRLERARRGWYEPTPK